jgi:methionyl-tRNA formyltransferase
MDQGIDSGPIVKKLPLSLAGFLPSILERISRFSFVLLYESLLSLQTTGKIPTYPQDSSLATTFKRRNPSQSILKINDLKNMSAIDLHNHVRCLQPPYPQLQIEFEDGTSLIIDKTSLA